DGVSDVIVGAPSHQLPNFNIGAAYIFFGGPSLLNRTTAGGELNARDANVKVEGDITTFGGTVYDSGDLNGDRLSDIIIGTASATGGQPSAISFFSGRPMLGTEKTIITAPETNARIRGNFAGSSSSSLSDIALEDFNGDKIVDMAVGSADDRAADTGGAGALFLIFGPLPSAKITAVPGGVSVGDAADRKLTGRAGGDQFGAGVIARE
ncbi:MAG: hypothetical protein AAB309_07420, partial [Deltaproteobacteria bacterium]